MFPNYYQNQQVIKVNGKNGASMYQLAPNSSALLLDETAPLVWLIQTDGAGYKSITPYEIKPYEPQAEPTITEVIDRIKKLEERLNESNSTKNDTKQSNDK